LSSDRPRSLKSVIVVRPPALPFFTALKNRTVSWCLPGNLGCLFDFLIRSSQPDENPKKFRLLKTLFAVFLIATAAAQTPPPDPARQIQLQKEAMRRAEAQAQAFTILGFPMLNPLRPVPILQSPLKKMENK